MPRGKPALPRKRPTKPRSVVPIPETLEQIRGYPDKLVIFKVPASPYWWMRYFDHRHIKRSTKTTDRREAIAAAKSFYEELLVNKRLGVSSNPRQSSFARCAEEMLKEDDQKAARGELSAKYVVTQKSMTRKHIMAFFGRREVSSIDYAVLDEFKTYLFEKKLATTSVKIHFVIVKKILDHAQRMNLLKATPLQPKVKREDNPRGFFSLPDYRTLRRTARRLLGTTSEVKQQVIKDGEAADKKLRNIVIGEEIQCLIPFMVYTFIRPTDIKQIKHRHIEIRKEDSREYLWMPLPESKRHDKPITSMPKAAIFYKRLRALRLAQLGNPNRDISDEYVFEPEQERRDYAYRKLTRQFDVILDAADLRTGPDGEQRTLYSLRHTSLMYRLRYGGPINPLQLASNARTSVDMLERFYMSRLESAQFTTELHARKPSKRAAREKATYTAPPLQPEDLKTMMERRRLPKSVGGRRVIMEGGVLKVADNT